MDQETTVVIERLKIEINQLAKMVQHLQTMTVLHAKDIETLQKPLRDPAHVHPAP